LIVAAMALRLKDDELLQTTDDATALADASAVATDADASASAYPSYLSEVKLDGGITIKTLAQGSGAACGAGQTAAVEYTGALASNGNVFDTSVGKDPISFEVGAMTMVKCWESAIPQMSVGQKADLGCPATTAYGGSAKPGIPANSDLIFNVELKSCQ
jgi:FKBP-type peptidyl-prolyl cis-trans isomerase